MKPKLIKKLICDQSVVFLARLIADHAHTLTEDQLDRLIDLDERWLIEAQAIFGEPSPAEKLEA